MMACNRRSDNLSLVKYGHSEIIRGESHTPKHDTCPGGEDRQRRERHNCPVAPSVPMSPVQVHVAGVAGLPAAGSRRLCAETNVLPRERCARSERRSVSERLTTMSCSGSRITHTHKDPGMPMEMQSLRQRNADMSHMLSLLGPCTASSATRLIGSVTQ